MFRNPEYMKHFVFLSLNAFHTLITLIASFNFGGLNERQTKDRIFILILSV